MKCVKPNRILTGLLLAACATTTWAVDDITSSLEKAVKDGTVALDFRYRFEGVDQDGVDKDAQASTLRSRITSTSGSLHGFTVLGEVDNVSVIGADKYNSTENDKTQYPVVADPGGTEINQVYLKYTADSANGIMGRQRKTAATSVLSAGSPGARMSRQRLSRGENGEQFQRDLGPGVSGQGRQHWAQGRV